MDLSQITSRSSQYPAGDGSTRPQPRFRGWGLSFFAISIGLLFVLVGRLEAASTAPACLSQFLASTSVLAAQHPEKNILRTGNKTCTMARLHSGAQGAFAGPANPGHKEGHMAQNTWRVVEGGAMDKTKALDAALSQIERAFGKG